jgi:ferritin-like metal-binding protein YciE
MSDDNLKQLVSQGLTAMKAGSDVAAKATDEISNDATHPALKAALEEGNNTSKQWAERIQRALEQTSGGGEQDNPILTALYEVSRRIRSQAPDATSRDLGIVASGQLALHYWIAAFGTMANYTRKLGLEDVARDMKQSADEAKQADEAHTGIAEQLLG